MSKNDTDLTVFSPSSNSNNQHGSTGSVSFNQYNISQKSLSASASFSRTTTKNSVTQNVINNFGSTAKSADGLITKLKPLFGLINNIMDVFEKVASKSDQFDEILVQVSDTVGELSSQFQPVIEEILPVLLKMIEEISPQLSEVIEAIMPSLTDLVNEALGPIMEIVEEIMPDLIDTLNELLPSLIEVVKKLLPGLVSAIGILLPVILEIIDKALPVLIELFNKLLPPIMELIVALLPPLVEIFMALLDPLLSLIENLLPPLIELFNAIIPLILLLCPIITILASIFSEVLSGAIDAVIPFLEGLIDTIASIIIFITDVFSGNWGKVWADIVKVFKNIINLIPEYIEAVVNTSIALINGIIKGINQITNNIGLPQIKTIPKVTLPRLRVGMDFVPSDDFPALLHRGEAVLTAQEADAYRRLGGISGIENMFAFMPYAPQLQTIVVNAGDMYLDGDKISKCVTNNQYTNAVARRIR